MDQYITKTENIQFFPDRASHRDMIYYLDTMLLYRDGLIETVYDGTRHGQRSNLTVSVYLENNIEKISLILIGNGVYLVYDILVGGNIEAFEAIKDLDLYEYGDFDF